MNLPLVFILIEEIQIKPPGEPQEKYIKVKLDKEGRILNIISYYLIW